MSVPRPPRLVATAVVAVGVLALPACGGSGGGTPGGGGADGAGDGGCVGDRTGQQVQRGVDGSLDDGTKLRVSFLTVKGGEDGAYVRWAPGTGGEPSADPARVRIGDTFDLGGTTYTLTGVCDDAAWVSGA